MAVPTGDVTVTTSSRSGYMETSKKKNVLLLSLAIKVSRTVRGLMRLFTKARNNNTNHSFKRHFIRSLERYD